VVSEVSRKPAYEYFVSVVGINMISKPGGPLGVKGARSSAEIDAELFNRAEKELAAFVAAVDTLHGEQQARAAADDWLLELTALKGPGKGGSPDLDLRSVTIRAARRLAQRLSTPTPAHAALALMAGVLLLAAPANVHAAHSNSPHPVTQDKLASVAGKHELSKIPTIPAQTRTILDAMCGLLTVVRRAHESSVRTNSTQEVKAMEAIGLLVTLEARQGKEADTEAFLKSAQPLAVDEKGTLKWYAIKLGPGKFGIFDTFANEGGRIAHLSGEIAKALGTRASELLAVPPQVEKVEILASTPLKG
jgi:quinol monooxygenase YgiN